MGQNNLSSTLIPLVVIGVVLALPMRKIGKDQPFSLARNWIMPGVVVLAAGALFVASPPSLLGWGVVLGFAAMGAPVGWHRGKLTHIGRDPQTGALTMRQSAAAVLVLVGIIALRQLAKVEAGDMIGTGAGKAARAMLFYDGMIGFALGMIIAFRTELYLRAKRLLAQPLPLG
jgi:membrane protein CcdC involved in cytochrome C biogenesis